MPRKIGRKGAVRKADEAFSRFIRKRDWKRGCVSCTTTFSAWNDQNLNCGHFQVRKHYATRWNEKNASAQCVNCNMGESGRQYVHGNELDLRWGEGTAEAMIQLAHSTVKLSIDDLKFIAQKYKE